MARNLLSLYASYLAMDDKEKYKAYKAWEKDGTWEALTTTQFKMDNKAYGQAMQAIQQKKGATAADYASALHGALTSSTDKKTFETAWNAADAIKTGRAFTDSVGKVDEDMLASVNDLGWERYFVGIGSKGGLEKPGLDDAYGFDLFARANAGYGQRQEARKQAEKEKEEARKLAEYEQEDAALRTDVKRRIDAWMETDGEKTQDVLGQKLTMTLPTFADLGLDESEYAAIKDKLKGTGKTFKKYVEELMGFGGAKKKVYEANPDTPEPKVPTAEDYALDPFALLKGREEVQGPTAQEQAQAAERDGKQRKAKAGEAKAENTITIDQAIAERAKLYAPLKMQLQGGQGMPPATSPEEATLNALAAYRAMGEWAANAATQEEYNYLAKVGLTGQTHTRNDYEKLTGSRDMPLGISAGVKESGKVGYTFDKPKGIADIEAFFGVTAEEAYATKQQIEAQDAWGALAGFVRDQNLLGQAGIAVAGGAVAGAANLAQGAGQLGMSAAEGAARLAAKASGYEWENDEELAWLGGRGAGSNPVGEAMDLAHAAVGSTEGVLPTLGMFVEMGTNMAVGGAAGKFLTAGVAAAGTAGTAGLTKTARFLKDATGSMASSVPFSIGEYGNAFRRAEKEGYSFEQSVAMGVTSGLTTAAIQGISAGIAATMPNPLAKYVQQPSVQQAYALGERTLRDKAAGVFVAALPRLMMAAPTSVAVNLAAKGVESAVLDKPFEVSAGELAKGAAISTLIAGVTVLFGAKETNRQIEQKLEDLVSVHADQVFFPGVTTLAELKRQRNAYAKQYHPDNFAGDPMGMEQATARMAMINSAYEQASATMNAASMTPSPKAEQVVKYIAAQSEFELENMMMTPADIMAVQETGQTSVTVARHVDTTARAVAATQMAMQQQTTATRQLEQVTQQRQEQGPLAMANPDVAKANIEAVQRVAEANRQVEETQEAQRAAQKNLYAAMDADAKEIAAQAASREMEAQAQAEPPTPEPRVPDAQYAGALAALEDMPDTMTRDAWLDAIRDMDDDAVETTQLRNWMQKQQGDIEGATVKRFLEERRAEHAETQPQRERFMAELMAKPGITPVEVTEPTLKEKGEKTKDIAGRLWQRVSDALQGKDTVINHDTGAEIIVSKKGIKETLGNGNTRSETRLAALSALPKTIENAVYVGSLPNWSGKTENFHYFVSAVRMDGNVHPVLVETKTDARGENRFYFQRIIGDTKTKADHLHGRGPSSDDATSQRAGEQPSNTLSIREASEKINLDKFTKWPLAKTLTTGEGKRVPVERMAVAEIQVDPAAYQFKGGQNLGNMKAYDANFGGAMLVHERKDGSVYVVNGHQRLELAKRTGTPEVEVRVLREADGVSVEDARDIGAMANIAEGRVAPEEAAQVLKEAGVDGYTEKANGQRQMANRPGERKPEPGAEGAADLPALGEAEGKEPGGAGGTQGMGAEDSGDYAAGFDRGINAWRATSGQNLTAALTERPKGRVRELAGTFEKTYKTPVHFFVTDSADIMAFESGGAIYVRNDIDAAEAAFAFGHELGHSKAREGDAAFTRMMEAVGEIPEEAVAAYLDALSYEAGEDGRGEVARLQADMAAAREEMVADAVGNAVYSALTGDDVAAVDAWLTPTQTKIIDEQAAQWGAREFERFSLRRAMKISVAEATQTEQAPKGYARVKALEEDIVEKTKVVNRNRRAINKRQTQLDAVTTDELRAPIEAELGPMQEAQKMAYGELKLLKDELARVKKKMPATPLNEGGIYLGQEAVYPERYVYADAKPGSLASENDLETIAYLRKGWTTTHTLTTEQTQRVFADAIGTAESIGEEAGEAAGNAAMLDDAVALAESKLKPLEKAHYANPDDWEAEREYLRALPALAELKVQQKRAWEDADKLTALGAADDVLAVIDGTAGIGGELPRPMLDTLLALADTGKTVGRFALNAESPERVMDDTFGKNAPIMRRVYVEPIHKHEAERQRMIATMREKVAALKLTPLESALVQELGEKRTTGLDIAELAKAKPADVLAAAKAWKEQTIHSEAMSKVPAAAKALGSRIDQKKLKPGDVKNLDKLDVKRLEEAVGVFREIYNELYDLTDDALRRNGQKELGRRTDYFPHFMDYTTPLVRAMKALGFEAEPFELPTDINGLTDMFRPGHQYSPHLQERLGDDTLLDAVWGFDRYVQSVTNVIHHTDDVVRLRQLDKDMRARYEGQLHLNNFTAWLTDYTNVLAGKKTQADRQIEGTFGRKAYTALTAVKSRVGSNMVAGNISSALTNVIPLAQSAAVYRADSWLHGMADTVKAALKDDGLMDRSDFFTAMVGSERLHKNALTRVKDAASIPFTAVDRTAAEMLLRMGYYDGLKKGYNETDAMRYADEMAGRILVNRSKGGKPLLFEQRATVAAALGQFQSEPMAAINLLLKDMPRMNEGHKARLLMAMMKYLLASFALNEGFQALTGRRPAPFDLIDTTKKFVEDVTGEDGDAGKAALNAAKDVAQDIPFANLLPFVGGGRIPSTQWIWDAITSIGQGDWLGAAQDIGYNFLLPFGGNQLRKTTQGVKAIAQGGVYNDSGRMKYAVSDDWWEAAKLAVFGTSSVPEAGTYYEEGRKPLSEKNTGYFDAAVAAGHDPQEAEDGIRAMAKITALKKQRKAAAEADNKDEVKRLNGLITAERKKLMLLKDVLLKQGAKIETYFKD